MSNSYARRVHKPSLDGKSKNEEVDMENISNMEVNADRGFRELSADEIASVSGGMSLEEGGMALIGIGIAGVTSPVIATGIGVFALSAGVTMLWGSIYGGGVKRGGGSAIVSV
jgi:hypothetical protein